MTRHDLLRNIADAGYNVGFGAKKHFATFDITDKVPAVIGYVSTAIGVFALFVPWLAANGLSAALIVLGVLGISIGLYDHKKDDYSVVGKQLTQIFNRLKSLYFRAKSAPDAELAEIEQQFASLEEEFGKVGITDQILFSGWYAHYKFFWEHQIDWIDEQKKFRLFRDKIPLSFMVCVMIVPMACVVIWSIKAVAELVR